MKDKIKEEVFKEEAPKAEVPEETSRATHEDLAAFLATHRPPEDVVMEVQFGAGDAKRVTEFHFRRSLAAFGRYTQLAYGEDGDVVAASLRFLVDSAVEAEKGLVAAFGDAYPVDAVAAARQLMTTYAFEGIETRIKNG